MTTDTQARFLGEFHRALLAVLGVGAWLALGFPLNAMRPGEAKSILAAIYMLGTICLWAVATAALVLG